VVVIIQPYSRWVGIAWMAAGLTIYFIYRRTQHIPLTHVVNEQENQSI